MEFSPDLRAQKMCIRDSSELIGINIDHHPAGIRRKRFKIEADLAESHPTAHTDDKIRVLDNEIAGTPAIDSKISIIAGMLSGKQVLSLIHI